jgi:hypothetical protein
MNEVIIRIIDTANNVEGDLELANFNDFPLAITKGIVNLDNLKERTGTYTKTFKVPNTKNNANLLSSVDNINSRKDYRDALNRKPCIILVNDNPIEKGFVQVSKVYNGFDLDSFELVFFGNNIDWVKDASELKLNSITWRNNAQQYTFGNINLYNNGTVLANDHAYPYISRGGSQSNNNTEIRDYYPAFYMKAIIDQCMNELGYNVSSTFLNTADIKKLMCDLNSDMKVAQSVIDLSKTRASKTLGSQQFFGQNKTKVTFNDDSTIPNEDVNNNWNTSTNAYTAPSTGTYNLNVTLNTNGFAEQLTQAGVTLVIRMCVGSGVDFGIDTFTVDSKEENISTINPNTTSVKLQANVEQGQLVTVFVSYYPASSFPFGFGYITNGSFFKIERSSELVAGDDFSLNELIPDNIKFIDVLNDFTRMFNIYYWTDIKTKTVYFEPRDTFFKSQTEALEWTNKLDISNKYELDYVSSYKRNIEFSYRDVDNDEWLKGWQDTNRRKYAKYTHKLPDRFAEGTTKIQLELFSASYAHVATEASPSINTAFTTLKYWNEYITDIGSIPTDRINGYNPRIFFYNYGTQTQVNGDSRQIVFNNTSPSNTIPAAIFETYNNTGTPQNLCFTNGTKTDGTEDKGLFATYYSKMLKNIEEGGRLIAYFNLSSTDIENLDFRKLIYLDNDYDVRGYYLIESVIDYKPVQNGLTKVSLFKFENLGSVSIDSSQEGNNSEDTDEGNTPPTLQPIYVEDGSQLIEVMIENPITGILEPVYK